MTLRNPAAAIILAALCLADTAAAQDGPWISRAIELPQHERLMERLDRPDAEIAPFTTDGCSGGMSDVWTFVAESFPAFSEVHENAPPWESCCITHDRAYYNAGGAGDAEASFTARLEADRTLQSCVADTATQRADALAEIYETTPDTVQVAYEAIALAMFQAVRLGGGPCSGLPWRWGYGFPDCR